LFAPDVHFAVGPPVAARERTNPLFAPPGLSTLTRCDVVPYIPVIVWHELLTDAEDILNDGLVTEMLLASSTSVLNTPA
jgi:hypothetical protein